MLEYEEKNLLYIVDTWGFENKEYGLNLLIVP